MCRETLMPSSTLLDSYALTSTFNVLKFFMWVDESFSRLSRFDDSSKEVTKTLTFALDCKATAKRICLGTQVHKIKRSNGKTNLGPLLWHRCCPVNCVVDSWSSWGSCNAACEQNGNRVRTRTVSTQASCNGSPCPTLRETKACRGPCCPRDCRVRIMLYWPVTQLFWWTIEQATSRKKKDTTSKGWWTYNCAVGDALIGPLAWLQS